MLPRLTELAPVSGTTRAYLDALAQAGFRGDAQRDDATRLVTATDNSIYQLLPQAVVFPRDAADVVRIFEVAARPAFAALTLTPRGGGTGTNGQALTSGVVVDLSRHMNRILDVDLEAMTARVQPGVVLDQLNDHLAPHGVFFAPNLSPSSRATIGGMIATDASGKGSRVYGKTSEHLISLDLVFVDGATHTTAPLDSAELSALALRDDSVGRLHAAVQRVTRDHAETIAATWPDLKRFLTGYNLAKVVQDGGCDLRWIIAGSEGTLATVTEATVRLTPLPAARGLVVLTYERFEDALADAQRLVAADPSAIETIDETVIELAKADVIWDAVAPFLAGDPATINLVEFEGQAAHVRAKVAELTATIEADGALATGYVVADGPASRAALWSLRKKGVGLLGARPGARKPVPFIEDTVVPPSELPAYVASLRAILDAEGLFYGMFGHVDVGCLHVRPALDLRSPEDEARLHRISDQVAALVHKHGGLIWGEHGKGMRAQYSPAFFGEELFEACCEVKGAADPDGRLNPGKVATPPGRRAELATIASPTRGAQDRQIAPASQARFETALACNGNGACFHYDPDHVMCPSSKVTRDRVHSPKGRAGVMREWLRQLSRAGYAVAATRPWGRLRSWLTLPIRAWHSAARRYDYSRDVYRAMDGCLSCKACATQCPIKVDVPALKTDFLDAYHRRYLRPPKDHVVAGLEGLLPWMARAPRLMNALSSPRAIRWLTRRLLGIVDVPRLAPRRVRGHTALSPAAIVVRAAAAQGPVVVVLQDAFTTHYEPHVVEAVLELIAALGVTPLWCRYRPSGKALDVKGFRRRFERHAARLARWLAPLGDAGLEVIGIDPAVTLTYRDELPVALGGAFPIRPKLVQEWLTGEPIASRIGALALDGPAAPGDADPAYALFGHCTERTAATRSDAQWLAALSRAGVRATSRAVGCCGMSGFFGHDAAHVDESRGIFEGSWARHLAEVDPPRVLATGYSCRSQVKRFGGGAQVRHPAEVLRDALTDRLPAT